MQVLYNPQRSSERIKLKYEFENEKVFATMRRYWDLYDRMGIGGVCLCVNINSLLFVTAY